MQRFGLSLEQLQDIERNLRRQLREYNRNRVPPVLNPIRPPPMAAPVYTSDPFEGDINPGDTAGIKLFTLATAERDKSEKLAISQDKVTEIMSAFLQDSNSFGWGILINQIPDAAGNNLSILEDFDKVTLDQVKAQSAKTFNNFGFALGNDLPDPMVQTVLDPANNGDHLRMFYRQSRSRMIAKRIQNSLTSASWKVLFSKRKHYSWRAPNGTVSYDGPTMLYLIVSSVNPSTRVGVSDLKTNLRQARLVQFKYIVPDLCDKMMADYQMILDRQKTHDDILLDLFEALLSGKNEVFTRFVQRRKDDWETGADESPESLVEACVAKYNNMLLQRTWKQEESKDSKIIALTTKVETLEAKLAAKDTNGTSSRLSTPKITIAKWRMTKDGDSKEVDGELWWWCPKHKVDGVYDGLYVKHKPEDHDDWLARKKKSKQAKRDGAPSLQNSSQNTNAKRLTLSNNLKAAMMSNFQCSEQQADKLWSEVVQNVDLN